MNGFIYRLQLLLNQKEEAKKEAERELRRQEEQLLAQLKVLESLQCKEKELLASRQQHRRDLLAKSDGEAPLSAQEVQLRSDYIKDLGFQIEQVRNSILSQRVVIEERESMVKRASENLKEAKREVEVLAKHRSKQEQRFLREQQAKEELALDEIGNVLYTTRRRAT